MFGAETSNGKCRPHAVHGSWAAMRLSDALPATFPFHTDKYRSSYKPPAAPRSAHPRGVRDLLEGPDNSHCEECAPRFFAHQECDVPRGTLIAGGFYCAHYRVWLAWPRQWGRCSHGRSLTSGDAAYRRDDWQDPASDVSRETSLSWADAITSEVSRETLVGSSASIIAP